MGKSKDVKEAKRRRADPVDQMDSDEEVVPGVDEKTDSASYEKDAQISFKSSEDIVHALSASNADLLIQGFTHLREHVKICNRSTEGDSAEMQALRESCRRVVYEWAEQSREFEAVAAAWQFALSNSVPRLDGLIPSVISGLLQAFDSPTTHKYGSQLVRLVLDGFMRAVYRAFNTPRSSACASILQMLYQMVVYSQGEHADQLRHSFDWTQKSLTTLPMTRSNIVGFSIRRLWIRFVLSFFSAERCKTFNQLLAARKVISSMFQGVEKDTYQELHTLLESVFTNIVLNEEITRADKVRVFGIHLVGNLVKASQNAQDITPQLVGIKSPALFVPSQATSSEPLTSDSLSALVTRFLRGLMAFPGYGICFKQYGLYTPPRRLGDEATAAANDDDNMQDVATFSKNSSSTEMQDLCNSQILRILVVCINPSASKHMSSLAIDIMRASPELIAPFWRNYHCSFEPRLSLSYLRNTGFAIKVMSLPLPRESEARYSAPPRLNTLVEHITPYPLDPLLVGRGLGAGAAPLVRYRNLLLVDVALRKLGDARAWIRAEARAAAGGGGEASKWMQLDQRLLAVVKQRIPQCKHVVSIHQHLLSLTEQSGTQTEDLREAECQHAVFSNALMRVMSGYQSHFSEGVLEAHFEFGTLISGIHLPDVVSVGKRVTERIRNPMNAHTLLYLLHALRTAALVKWMTRVKPVEGSGSGSGQHTYLGVILMVYLFAVQPELRLAARVVAVGALQSTGLFDHDASGDEAQCWLDALSMVASPHAGRNTRLAFIADGGIAKGQGLVSFVEDAVLLSSKLPYKYADRIHASADDDDGGDQQLPFSPLLAAVVEAVILKLAFGAKSQGSNWREEASVERIAGEMLTTDMCGLVNEVVCRVAESRGMEVTRRLGQFVPMAAALTMAPRIAKLDGEKHPQKVDDEKRYCAKIESAFADATRGTVDYLLTTAAGVVTAQKPATGGRIDGAVEMQLKRELASGCGNIEDGLSQLMTQLALALREHGLPVSAITEWLLAQAQGAAGGERQAVCIATITWISAYHRVSLGGHSLWDTPAFVGLAGEILQIDDASFLLSMFRHLLSSKALVALVGDNASAQRLLAHALLANKGSRQFSVYGVQLVRSLATQTAGADGEQVSKALSFAFALIYEHMASIDDRAQPLEQYARALAPFMLESPQSVLDYNLSVLARRSAHIWISPVAAGKTWHALLVRMETALLAPDMGTTQMVYLLSLLCVASPAASEGSRSGLIRLLGDFARGQPTQDALCAAATAVFTLLHDSQGSSDLEGLEHVRAARTYLTTKVVGLWLSSLGSTHSSSSEGLLERAAQLATGTAIVVANAASSLSLSVELARAQLPRLGQAYSPATAIDAAGGALEHLWQRAGDKSSYAGDSSRRALLARIVSADSHLGAKACAWMHRMLESPSEITGYRTHFLAALLRAMAALCMREAAPGVIAWDGSTASQQLASLCLALGACLFGAGSSRTSARLSEMASDVDLLFVANAFVQRSEDAAAIEALRRRLAKAADVSPVVRATLLRSMALRSAVFPEQGDAGLAAFAALAAIAPLADDAALSGVVASAMEHCVHFAQRLGSDIAADAAAKAVAAGFRSVDALSHSICLPFDAADGLSAEELQQRITQHPVAQYRMLAFTAMATHCIVSAASLQPSAELRWFSVLRRLLDCRLLSARMRVSGVGDLLALSVSRLWDLSKPSLSRWSASLDDYLTLDQLEGLMGAYGGTRSLPDQVLLRVIADYEQTTRQSIQRVALAFGPTAAAAYVKERVGRTRYAIDRDENDIGVVTEDTLSSALLAVDSGKLFRTVLNFPVNHAPTADPVAQLLNAVCGGGAKPGLDVNESALVYDAHFILAWVWTLVSSRVLVDIRRLFETNAAGLALVALSSGDARTRKLAYFILDVLYARVADAKNLHGQRQYLLLLDALRNAIMHRSEAEFPRIPFAITIFVATSLNVLMHPEHAMFADVNQLLLRRPYLRLNDIPLLRSALRSGANVRKQRTHVLRQAAQSARAFDLSLAAFKNADFVNVTLVLAANPLGDVLTSRAAMTLLFHLTAADNPRGLALYISRHSSFVLAWIRQQVALEANSLVEASSRASLNGESAQSALLMQPALAALGNLTALMRVVLRAVANYPLSVRADGTLLHDRFWVVQSTTQPNAPGQIVALTIALQILGALASSLEILQGSLATDFVQSALILLRTCLDIARLLADMQAGASDQQPPALRAPEIARNALLALRAVEPVIARADYALRYDPCSAASVAAAQFSESLFCNDVVVEGPHGAYACYCLCVESLLAWCLDVPWATCSLRESVDIVARAMVVGAHGARRARAWIREAQLVCANKDERVLNDRLQVLALSQ